VSTMTAMLSIWILLRRHAEMVFLKLWQSRCLPEVNLYRREMQHLETLIASFCTLGLIAKHQRWHSQRFNIDNGFPNIQLTARYYAACSAVSAIAATSSRRIRLCSCPALSAMLTG
jgi:hypothetical protein